MSTVSIAGINSSHCTDSTQVSTHNGTAQTMQHQHQHTWCDWQQGSAHLQLAVLISICLCEQLPTTNLNEQSLELRNTYPYTKKEHTHNQWQAWQVRTCVTASAGKPSPDSLSNCSNSPTVAAHLQWPSVTAGVSTWLEAAVAILVADLKQMLQVRLQLIHWHLRPRQWWLGTCIATVIQQSFMAAYQLLPLVVYQLMPLFACQLLPLVA